MLQAIVQNIVNYFYVYGKDSGKIAAVLFVLVLLAEGTFNKKIGKTLKDAVVVALLGMYLYMVIGITMLSRWESYTDIVNLKVFSTFGRGFSDRMYIYENILLFIPLGGLLFLLAKPFRKWWVSLGIGIWGSVCIEAGQYVTHLGRVEADDVLTNTVGMMLGFFFGKIVVTSIRHIRIK